MTHIYSGWFNPKVEFPLFFSHTLMSENRNEQLHPPFNCGKLKYNLYLSIQLVSDAGKLRRDEEV